MKKILALLLVCCLTFVLAACQKSENSLSHPDEPVETELPLASEKQEPEPYIYNEITGSPVEKLDQKLLAVMINNHPKARPQTGLIDADLVYEMEMEGFITRFLAFFYGDPPQNVGPVRSARPYPMMIAKEWDAYYAHVGGSNEAYALMSTWQIPDIDDMRGDQGFWLDKTRNRPHNTYLNIEKALAAKAERGVLHNWLFEDYPINTNPDFDEIALYYDSTNSPKYVFDQESQKYMRYINNVPHTDRITGTQISVNNIIIQYAKHHHTNDALKHIEIDLIGSGKAEYFIAGRHLTGQWQKEDLTSPTLYLDENGDPIIFDPGKTWVQVIRDTKNIATTKYAVD